ncbi:MAG TPA: cupin domain-containing protein [Candidatus Baltobacteraceae bacterium]|jgi:quercetin dioxygenase-like cupin family protein
MKRTSVALFCLSALIAVLGSHASGQTETSPVNVATKVMTVTVSSPGDYELVNQVLDIPPGGTIPNHSHGGPVIVTVISGEFTIKDGAGSHVLTAGQSATEETGYRHSAANNGTSTARLAISYFIPKGAARTTVVQ